MNSSRRAKERRRFVWPGVDAEQRKAEQLGKAVGCLALVDH